MLTKILQFFKKHSNPNVKTQRKRAIKGWIANLGINWCDVENVLFWNDVRWSLMFFIFFTALFWKFLVYKVQMAAAITIIAIIPLMIEELQISAKKFIIENLKFQILPENKRLGFDLDDVCDCGAELWIQLDQHYQYLINMKCEKNPLLVFILVGYGTVIILIHSYVPIAHVIYLFVSLLYFLPILNYIGFFDKSFEKIDKLIQPFVMHWAHNQTKRKRNRLRKVDRLHSPKKTANQSSTDSEDFENEQFLPERNKYNTKMLMSAIPSCHDDSVNESHDEFELHLGQRTGKIHDGDHSSDYDESAFLPSYMGNYSVGGGMPSMSQFDSLMEPLDDEFHTGLNFKNVSTVSHSDFGVPGSFSGKVDLGENTDDDIDDLPVEQTDYFQDQEHHEIYKNTAATGAVQHIDEDKSNQHVEQKEDQDYEFLDRTELNDVTDEEINEQIKETTSGSITRGVSNMLGY